VTLTGAIQTLASVSFTLAAGQKAILMAQVVAAGSGVASAGTMSTRIQDGGVTLASSGQDYPAAVNTVSTAMVTETSTVGAHTINLQASATVATLTVGTQAQIVAVIVAV
jgi:hypothetical protein